MTAGGVNGSVGVGALALVLIALTTMFDHSVQHCWLIDWVGLIQDDGRSGGRGVGSIVDLVWMMLVLLMVLRILLI